MIGFPFRSLAFEKSSQDAQRSLAYFNDTLMTDPSGQMPAYCRPRGYRGARRLFDTQAVCTWQGY